MLDPYPLTLARAPSERLGISRRAGAFFNPAKGAYYAQKNVDVTIKRKKIGVNHSY